MSGIPPVQSGGASTKKQSEKSMFGYLHNRLMEINDSKIFAGIMIVILNISSKYVIPKLPKSIESYLKHSFSRNLLIYVIAWMGTRNIYVAFGIMLIFIICIDFLCNEESMFCILPETFVQEHHKKMDEADVSDEKIAEAITILKRAEKQGKLTDALVNT